MSEEKEPETFDTINGEVTLQRLLARAIKTEIESAETYRTLLEKDLPEETKQKIEKLVAQEEEHEDNFSSIFDDFFPEDEIPLPERSDIEVMSEIPQDATPQQLIEKALETERESEKFYSDLVGEFEDREVRRLMGYLAANEREHYEILKEELTKLG
ncbi:MAG: ferritin family protein [Candidatus Bipolaricaulota bacterium]|nr:ferritin family protein [Candidatus Bipolaricaulota bacterium]